MAYGSELNQVWTNLIDNATDAMKGKRENCSFAPCVKMITCLWRSPTTAPEFRLRVQSRIFEPLFYDQRRGRGTGLGLDVVHRIGEKNARAHHRKIGFWEYPIPSANSDSSCTVIPRETTMGRKLVSTSIRLNA